MACMHSVLALPTVPTVYLDRRSTEGSGTATSQRGPPPNYASDSRDSAPSVPQAEPPSIGPNDSGRRQPGRGSARSSRATISPSDSASNGRRQPRGRNSRNRRGSINITFSPVMKNYLNHPNLPGGPFMRPFGPPGFPQPFVHGNQNPAFHLGPQPGPPGFPQPQFDHGNQNPAFHLRPQPGRF